MARWNFPVKVEALERASCQRGLAGRRRTGVAFVAAVHNYSRRLPAGERGGPGMSRAEA